MKMIKMQCTNCGAMLDIDEEKKIAFCPYCGTKLAIDDETVNVNISYRDEAKIMEMEMKQDRYATLKRLYDEEDRQFEEKYTKWQKLFDKWKRLFWVTIIYVAVIYLIGLVFRAMGFQEWAAQRENIVLPVAFILGLPIFVAYWVLIFGGLYLYLMNPKRKYMKQLQKREKNDAKLRR